jgi:hypothetical protein
VLHGAAVTVDIDGLFPAMRNRVRYMLADPEAKALSVSVVSAFRSIELQRTLFGDAVRRYGSEAAARKWVAPPGKSNHGPMVDDHGHKPGPYGQAVDLGVAGFAAVSGKWPTDIKARMDELCARYGMRSPMTWEDWHYEPLPGFVDPPSWPGEPVAHVFPPSIVTEEDEMIAVDPHTGDFWRCGPDGAVNAFDKNGAPSNRYLGGANAHPEWNVGPGKPLGPVIAFTWWEGDGTPEGGLGYQMVTLAPADGQFHAYHFRGNGADR